MSASRVPSPPLDAHIARCPACRAYRDNAHQLRRAGSLYRAPRLPDLSARVVKLDRLADRAGRWGIARGLLVVVAVQIIALSLPALATGGEQSTSTHDARHLGAFIVAYAAALLVVAARPARARTVLPVAYVLAAALVMTALVDVVNAQIPLTGEVIHLPKLISVVLIRLLAVPAPRRPDDHTASPARPAITLVRPQTDDQYRRRRA